MPDPFAQVASPVQGADPFAGVASAAPSAASTDWQKQVKPIDLGNGKTSVQRSDGGVWFGPEQGNTGTPGWFDGKGNRLGAAPGAPPEQPGWFSRLGYGAKLGLHSLGDSLAQFGVQSVSNTTGGAIGEPSTVQAVNQDVAANEAQRNQQASALGAPTKIGKFATSTVPIVVGGMLVAPEAEGAGLLTRAGATGASVAPVTYLTTPGTEQERATAAAVSAPAAAGGQIVGEKVIAPIVSKIAANPSALNPVNWATAGMRRLLVGKYGPAAQDIIDTTSQQGVSLKPSQVIGAAQKATPAPEVAQAKTALQNLSDDLAQNTANTPWKGLPRVQAAAANGDKDAQALLQSIDTNALDPNQITQDSGALQAMRIRLIKNALWNKTGDLAGDYNFNLGGMYRTIQDIRAQVAGAHPEVKDAVNKFLDNIEQSYFPQRDAATGRMLKPTSATDWQGLMGPYGLKVALNGQISTVPADASGQAVNQAAAQVKQSLLGDIQQGVASKGDDSLLNAFNRANDFHINQYVPTKFGSPGNFANAFDTEDARNPLFSDQLYKTLANKAKTPQQARAIASALGDKGRAALAQTVVENAVQNGVNLRTGTWIPGQSASDLAGRMNTLNAVLPSGPQRMQLNGAVKMLQHLAQVTPENASALGDRFVNSAEAASSKVGAVTKTFQFIKNGGIDLLFNSPKGRDLLFQMGDAKPGSPMASGIMSKILDLIPPSSAATTSRIQSPSMISTPQAAQNQQPQPDQVAQLQ